MLPLPLDSLPAVFQSVNLVATDMDGTLTTTGKLTAEVLQSFHTLRQAGVEVLVVTGRSAGWMSGLVHYLPIWGAIAENGGVFYPGQAESPSLLVTIPDLTRHRQTLADIFGQLKAAFPQLQESADNAYRLTDWTFDVQGLGQDTIAHLRDRCQAEGWGFTYSTVQCHIKLPDQSKATGLQQVLQQHFPLASPTSVVTVGDSPNDETLFDARLFPLSVGVANVMHYRDQMQHLPAYVTHAAEGAGFCELARTLLSARSWSVATL